jgi:hypothetical protein
VKGRKGDWEIRCWGLSSLNSPFEELVRPLAEGKGDVKDKRQKTKVKRQKLKEM